ncbi:MAG TPA: phospholipase D-like domain-containing protein [Candidatus Nanoarchaeia archaeon]|nr:phospholipase D-like domain-containing protein [Candidatus Nanoarchaeia archaeon]
MRWLLFVLLLTACTPTAHVIREFSDPTEVYFCPHDDCRGKFIEQLRNAQTIDCAVYDIDLPEVIDELNSKHARVVLDHESSLFTNNATIDSKYTQMHNKFCVLDNKIVISGSMNPTLRDTSINYNNLLIIHSKDIAKTYTEEFNELYSGTFSGGDRTIKTQHYVNDETIETYFCPEDWCVNEILYVMDEAKESIHFMVFSFTHDKIGDMLLKKAAQGLIVDGFMEKSQNNAYSEFKRLNGTIPVQWESTGVNLHHKVFIIDRKIVITGSINPSVNGDTKNDENMLIIHSPRLAESYLHEYEIITK